MSGIEDSCRPCRAFDRPLVGTRGGASRRLPLHCAPGWFVAALQVVRLREPPVPIRLTLGSLFNGRRRATILSRSDAPEFIAQSPPGRPFMSRCHRRIRSAFPLCAIAVSFAMVIGHFAPPAFAADPVIDPVGKEIIANVDAMRGE